MDLHFVQVGRCGSRGDASKPYRKASRIRASHRKLPDPEDFPPLYSEALPLARELIFYTIEAPIVLRDAVKELPQRGHDTVSGTERTRVGMRALCDLDQPMEHEAVGNDPLQGSYDVSIECGAVGI
jgi:hypothetical protein